MMTIKGINSVEPIQPSQKPERTGAARGSRTEDTVSISPAALEKAELYRVKELAMAAPDIREDRVAEVLERMNDPAYFDNRIDGTADKIMEAFGI